MQEKLRGRQRYLEFTYLARVSWARLLCVAREIALRRKLKTFIFFGDQSNRVTALLGDVAYVHVPVDVMRIDHGPFFLRSQAPVPLLYGYLPAGRLVSSRAG